MLAYLGAVLFENVAQYILSLLKVICLYFDSIRAGCTALPPLLTIKQVMQQRQCTGVWNSKDELPVCELCNLHCVSVVPIIVSFHIVIVPV